MLCCNTRMQVTAEVEKITGSIWLKNAQSVPALDSWRSREGDGEGRRGGGGRGAQRSLLRLHLPGPPMQL